jgi:chromosome segregation ATPase
MASNILGFADPGTLRVPGDPANYHGTIVSKKLNALIGVVNTLNTHIHSLQHQATTAKITNELLAKTIIELKAESETSKQKIAAIQQKNNDLRRRIDELERMKENENEWALVRQ